MALRAALPGSPGPRARAAPEVGLFSGDLLVIFLGVSGLGCVCVFLLNPLLPQRSASGLPSTKRKCAKSQAQGLGPGPLGG